MIKMTPDLKKLINKYDRPGPRYTSYPMVPVWDNDFGPDDFDRLLRGAGSEAEKQLSIYLHIPFCRQRCLFCGCNTTALKKDSVHSQYLERVEREADLVFSRLGQRREISQLHWGGGTPTCLDSANTVRAFELVSKRGEIRDDAEISVELDPRVTDNDRINLLKELGFNRLSFGIQDFNQVVQQAIGRNQDTDKTIELYRFSRELGFKGINFDLIYGLPSQTLESFESSIEKTIELRPDRIALYSFAYIPKMRPHQNRLDESLLPDASEKLRLFLMARGRFVEAGYEAIGMDHFVVPEDELALAARENRLRRNFMGYTVRSAEDWVGLGMSSISYINQGYAQNHGSLKDYNPALDRNELATCRGMKLSHDDLIRRYVISELMCNFRLDLKKIEDLFEIDAKAYLKDELSELEEFAMDGLLEREADRLAVNGTGKIFIRNIAMTFDAYLRKGKMKTQFSRTV
ncbi:MAG: oxygen-independent coproporphyrinogen III oxidase [candidate division Zixibacteria bacterium]|nr:oxygen-independent coproporphyrinogen III oxidase [candidate division Zixibacteria bacterium]